MLHSPVKSLIVQSLGEGIMNDPTWPSMFMLAWYTHTFKPQTFVDYSFLYEIPSIAVPLIYPCITYIGIDEFENQSLVASLYSMITLLYKVGFQGRLHILSGEINSSFERLSESAKLYDKYDLIHFAPELFPDTYINQLEHMIRYTSKGGAIVITVRRPDYLQQISSWLSDQCNECLFIKSVEGGACMLIRDEGRDTSRDRNSGFDEYTEQSYLELILGQSVSSQGTRGKPGIDINAKQ